MHELHQIYGKYRAKGRLLPFDQLREHYGSVINKLFESDRSYSNKDSFALGFMQARIDGRSNFQPTNDKVGLFADCSTKLGLNRAQPKFYLVALTRHAESGPKDAVHFGQMVLSIDIFALQFGFGHRPTELRVWASSSN
jgi:hypothetical protein